MHVITGTARGRRLLSPEGLDIRPTSSRVKEAIFSVLQFEIPDRRVLDMFAGSGQLGIEALSRGAKEAVFIDSSRQATNVIRENLKTTGLTDKARVIMGDSFVSLSSLHEKFDIVFVDPPYAQEMFQKALETVSPYVRSGGAVVCEFNRREDVPTSADKLDLHRVYTYGKTHVALYRMAQEDAE